MSQTLRLDPVLDIKAAEPLKAAFLNLRGRPLALDASAVERLGGLCLQVLISARKTWQADGQALRLADASTAFIEQLVAFGDPDIQTTPEGGQTQ